MHRQWNMPVKCPVCQGSYEVTQLECTGCHSRLAGRFRASRFDSLSAEQMHFVETFLGSRGNIKEVEKRLGISYPTVRARLDDLITALELDGPVRYSNNLDVLGALSRGELSVEEAKEEIEMITKKEGRK